MVTFTTDGRAYSKEVNNHLSGIVQLKSERVDDYFVERKDDLGFLSSLQETRGTVSATYVSSKVDAQNYLNYKLDIISRQIDIFLEKYPDKGIDFFKSDDFKNVINQKIGSSGSTYLVDSNDLVIIGDRGAGDIDAKLGKSFFINRVNYYLSGVVNSDEFIVSPKSEDTESLDLFFEISNYSNLILISNLGNVIYDAVGSISSGVNLNDYFDSELSKALEKARVVKGDMVHGPYKMPDSNKLEIIFISPIENSDGYVVLIDNFNSINSISSEKSNIDGDFYIVDKDKLLLTPVLDFPDSVLVQTVDTSNSERCFGGRENIILPTKDFRGQEVLGSFNYLKESGWCLLSEVPTENLRLKLKDGLNWMSLTFISLLVLLTLLGILVFRKVESGSLKFVPKGGTVIGILLISIGMVLSFIFDTWLTSFELFGLFASLFFFIKIVGFFFVFSGSLLNGGNRK